MEKYEEKIEYLKKKYPLENLEHIISYYANLDNHNKTIFDDWVYVMNGLKEISEKSPNLFNDFEQLEEERIHSTYSKEEIDKLHEQLEKMFYSKKKVVPKR